MRSLQRFGLLSRSQNTDSAKISWLYQSVSYRHKSSHVSPSLSAPSFNKQSDLAYSIAECNFHFPENRYRKNTVSIGILQHRTTGWPLHYSSTTWLWTAGTVSQKCLQRNPNINHDMAYFCAATIASCSTAHLSRKPRKPIRFDNPNFSHSMAGLSPLTSTVAVCFFFLVH
jgi:hypothetical protein